MIRCGRVSSSVSHSEPRSWYGCKQSVERAIQAYELEVFHGDDLVKQVAIEQHPENAPWLYSLRFTPKAPPVPGSVMVWENDGLMAPTRVSVEGRVLRVKIANERATDAAWFREQEYVVRYLRTPEL
jgi:hypothetical protein